MLNKKEKLKKQERLKIRDNLRVQQKMMSHNPKNLLKARKNLKDKKLVSSS